MGITSILHVIDEEGRDFSDLFIHLQIMANSIHSFLKDTKMEEEEESCFEVFVYNHCYSNIWKVFQSCSFLQEADGKFDEKLTTFSSTLQPSHLDIIWICSSPEEFDSLFEKVIKQIQEIHSVFSPYLKLKCIHNAYKEMIHIISRLKK